MIVIGGGVMAAGDLLLDPAREEFAGRALPPQNRIPIRAAALGADAGMIGAALLAAEELGRRGARLMAGRLIVCPTPIGNIGRRLAAPAPTACARPTSSPARTPAEPGASTSASSSKPPRFVSNHDANEEARAPQIAKAIERGARVALISDAGTPVLSDPGYRLIRDVHRARPRGRGAARAVGDHDRPRRLRRCRRTAGGSRDSCRGAPGELERVLQSTETVVAFESPRRLPDSLRALAALAPDRPAAVCRELTKLHEEVARGSLGELARHFRGEQKGEIVVVIAPSRRRASAPDTAFAVDALRRLVQSGARPRAAAGVVAALTGTRPNELYRELTGREPRR